MAADDDVGSNEESAYDAFGGWMRMFDAADKLDTNAALVMTLHAALEREMDDVLGRQVPYPERLKGLGFGQKVKVIAATWPHQAETADQVHEALFRFNELRNVVAHSDDRKKLNGAYNALRAAHQQFGSRQENVDELVNIACDICALMGGHQMTIAEFHAFGAAIGSLLGKLADVFKRPSPPTILGGAANP